MAQQIPIDRSARAKDRRAEDASDGTQEIAPDIAYRRLGIVNVVFVGERAAGDGGWVLIDTGIPGTASFILSAVDERFGRGARPAAIIMTHGHFDHVGGLTHLAERWDVPVHAHALERPYLDGSASYPPPDPSVGGGLMARLSPLYPRGPVDVGARLHDLPEDGSVPGMPGWRWIATPGHSAGHVSFWREADRALIAGDAFITTRQESAYAAITQEPEVHGPPMYFTTNWQKARVSVERLADLEPALAVTGHGPAMQGAEMRDALHRLAADFDRVAVPADGRYADHPAEVEDGSEYRKP